MESFVICAIHQNMRNTGWMVNVARMEVRCVRDFCRKPNELEDLGIDGKGNMFQWVLAG